jgi:hypothetical protein
MEHSKVKKKTPKSHSDRQNKGFQENQEEKEGNRNRDRRLWREKENQNLPRQKAKEAKANKNKIPEESRTRQDKTTEFKGLPLLRNELENKIHVLKKIESLRRQSRKAGCE